MSTGKDIQVGIVLTGDSSGLRGELKVSAQDLDKLKASATAAGQGASQAFEKMSGAQQKHASQSKAWSNLEVRSSRQIQLEISKTQASYKRLATSGSVSAQDLSRAALATKNKVAKLNQELKGASASTSMLGSSVGRLVGAAAIFYGIQRGVNAAEAAVMRSQSAILGLSSIAKHAGVDVKESLVASLKLSADGMMTNAESAKALQNLLNRGFSLQESIDLINRFRDSAAYGRQASLKFGEAVVSATEGIKNENSILVDNAGVTKNVSVMWKEYAAQIGVSVNDLTIAQKRQAEYNGIVHETAGQLGNAQEASKGLQGAQARANKATEDAANAYGEALTPALMAYYEITTKAIGVVGSMADHLPELAVGIAAVSTQFVAGKASAIGWAGGVTTAKVAVAGLLRTMLPLAGAFAVFEVGKVGLEAYAAGQAQAASEDARLQNSLKISTYFFKKNREEIIALGLDIDTFAGENTLEEHAVKFDDFLEKWHKAKRLAAGGLPVTPAPIVDIPAVDPPAKVIPIDPEKMKASADAASELTTQLATSFDDTFTKTSEKYSSTWQALVATHGAGSAQVQSLESAYQTYLDQTWSAAEEKDKARANKVVSLQAAKYARMNEAARLNVGTDEERALNKLDFDLQAMETERQRLFDQHLWTDSLESSYDEARINRAQETAEILAQIGEEESAAKLQRLIDGEQAGYNLKAQMQQAFAADQQVNLNAMLGNIQTYAKASADWDKWTGDQKLGFTAASLGAVSSLMNSKNREMFEIGKVAAHSENVIHTSLGATKAISTLGPIAGTIAAAGIIAAGVANSQTINAQQFGSASGGSSTVPTISAGGSGGIPTVPIDAPTGLPVQQRAEAQSVSAAPALAPQYTLIFQNPIMSRDFVENDVVPILRDIDENGEVTIIGANGRTAQEIRDAA